MPPDPNVHVAVGAIIRRGNDLLLLQRGRHSDGYGTWALPGGWLEYGEYPYDAARREVAEETGLLVQPVDSDGFEVVTWDDGKRLVVVLFIVCNYLGGEPINAEPHKALEVKWVDSMLLVELDLYTALDRWFRRPRSELAHVYGSGGSAQVCTCPLGRNHI